MTNRIVAGVATAVDDRVVKKAMRTLLRVGLAPKAFALLETRGRRTGKLRQTPVGNGLVDDTFWLIAARGEAAHYVRNLRHDPAVKIKIGRRWLTGTARVLPDEDPAERLRYILDHSGWLRRMDAKALDSSIRMTDSTPCVIKIDIDHHAIANMPAGS